MERSQEFIGRLSKDGRIDMMELLMEYGAPATSFYVRDVRKATRLEGIVRSVLAARIALLQTPQLLPELWSVVYVYANAHTLDEKERALIRKKEWGFYI